MATQRQDLLAKTIGSLHGNVHRLSDYIEQQAIGYGQLTRIAATGHTQANGAAVSASCVLVLTATTTTADALTLQASVPVVLIRNRSGVVLQVFPPSGEQIGTGSVNAVATLADGVDATYTRDAAASPAVWWK